MNDLNTYLFEYSNIQIKKYRQRTPASVYLYLFFLREPPIYFLKCDVIVSWFVGLHNPYLINWTLIWVSLWRYFVNAVDVYGSVDFKWGRLSWLPGWAWLNRVEATERYPGSPEEECVRPACGQQLKPMPGGQRPSWWPASWISDLPRQPHNIINQFLAINLFLRRKQHAF